LITDKAHVHLVNAYHPLLYLYNLKAQKQTIPTQISLNEKNRILVISGPNAGGKTVTLKTVWTFAINVAKWFTDPGSSRIRTGGSLNRS
jgi:DNA mismatch repair protein MutS2